MDERRGEERKGEEEEEKSVGGVCALDTPNSVLTTERAALN